MALSLNKYQQEAVLHKDGPALVTSCPGSGKCVVGDTLVCSEEELVSEIHYNKVKSVIGLSSENLSDISSSSRNISEFVNSGVHQTIKIITKNGYEIEGTYDHPIVILNKSGNFEWKKLKDINEKDICPIWVNNKISFNYELDEKFYMIGLLLGDGSLVTKNKISFHSENNNLSEKFCQIIKKYYNYDCKIYKDKRRKNLYSYNIYSAKIRQILSQEFGDIFHLSCEKYLTEEILRGSKAQIASLIRGIFDTDGSASENMCDIILCSKKLIDQLHILLLHYGIFSTKKIKKVEGKEYYRIQIYGNNYRRFVKNISFGHSNKIEISNRIIGKKKNSNQIIPYMQIRMENILKQLSIDNPEWYCRNKQTLLCGEGDIRLARYRAKNIKNIRNVTEDSINRINKIFKENNYASCDFEYVNNLNNYCYSEVVKKEYGENKKSVYDYVIPKTHSFIANGFINHNTFVLVERLVCLLQDGVKPKNILCLTFTNKAANEMKERVCKRLGVENIDCFIGTFHSLCAKMIRKIGPSQGYQSNFTIIDDKDQIDLIMQIARRMEVKIEKVDAFKIANRLNYYRDQMEAFEWVEDSLRLDVYIEIAKNYLKHCRNNNLLDFSALIYENIKIIESDEDLKRKIQNTFKYIMVDETQDTNKSQFYLVNLLGGKWKNVMIIGDTDQSIYRFRGARYQNIQDFIDNYSDCKVISLSKNYRSTPQIVSIASKLIKFNTSHMDIAFETDNDAGKKVQSYSFGDQYIEGNWVGKTAKRFIEEGGWDPSDIAVLYRANKMSEPIEQALVNNCIPYAVVGSWNFYDRREVRDCLSMLKLLSNPRDGIAFGRICSFIDGMGDVTVGKIENIAQESNITIPQACKIMAEKSKSIKIARGCEKISSIYNGQWDYSNPASCVSKLIGNLNYEQYLTNKFNDTCIERKENINQIITSAAECNGEEDGVSKYLQRVSLITNADNKDKDNKMSLMSIHAAKGLEFPIVFMVGVEEDLLPHKTAMADDPYEGLEEERRLCYVGMTRAKEVLLLSYCERRRRFGKHGAPTYNKCKPSRFLYESGVLKK